MNSPILLSNDHCECACLCEHLGEDFGVLAQTINNLTPDNQVNCNFAVTNHSHENHSILNNILQAAVNRLKIQQEQIHTLNALLQQMQQLSTVDKK